MTVHCVKNLSQRQTSGISVCHWNAYRSRSVGRLTRFY